MRIFRPTHIAVNLLLIVALAIQPVAVCLAGVVGGPACSEPGRFTCQGCGCCEVERPDGRCCCCSGPADAEEVEASCCSSNHDSAENSEASPEQQTASSIAPGDAGVRSICLCEQRSPPLSDSSPRRPTTEDRDVVSLESIDLHGYAWNSGRLVAKRQATAPLVPPSHFAQVMLCIWRL
jgi:hypothetical protein